MGGPESELYSEFKYLLLDGLKAARKHMDRIINIVEIMRSSKLCLAGCPGFRINRSLFRLQVRSCRASRTVAPVRCAIYAIASTWTWPSRSWSARSSSWYRTRWTHCRPSCTMATNTSRMAFCESDSTWKSKQARKATMQQEKVQISTDDPAARMGYSIFLHIGIAWSSNGGSSSIAFTSLFSTSLSYIR